MLVPCVGRFLRAHHLFISLLLVNITFCKDQYIVGGLAITGSARLFQQWNSTFATYLTAALREIPQYSNISFKLVSLDFYSTFTMVSFYHGVKRKMCGYA